MSSVTPRVIVIALAAVTAACAIEKTTIPQSVSESAAPDNAYTSLPAGYSNDLSSYSASADSGSAWVPGVPGVPGGPGGPGAALVAGPFGGPGGSGDLGGFNMWPGAPLLMGGGLGPAFSGMNVGPALGGRPFDDNILPTSCTYSATTGFVTCPTQTIGGLTINRSAEYTTASGASQPSVDSLTNTVLTETSVSGTVTSGVRQQHQNDSTFTIADTSTVNEASSRTVTGLAAGSTQRTVNGTSSGTELTSGTSGSKGHFTASRSVGDTIAGLVEPIDVGHMAYPTAGTVTRSMQATLTYAGQTPTTTSRREVVTYNGTATATIVITQDGTTTTCTMPLPMGRLTCGQ